MNRPLAKRFIENFFKSEDAEIFCRNEEIFYNYLFSQKTDVGFDLSEKSEESDIENS